MDNTKGITLPFSILKEQLDLEKDMRDRGIRRFRKRLTEHKQRGEESFTNYGKTLLSNSIRPFSEGIKAFKPCNLFIDELNIIILLLLYNQQPSIHL